MSQSRTISPSNYRFDSARSRGYRNRYKRSARTVSDYHGSPIALQKAATKRKTAKLEDLSMKYSLAESRSRMASQRSERSHTAVSVLITRDESENLCSLGKRLFEDAVDRATSSGSTEPSASCDSVQSFPSLGSSNMKEFPAYASVHKRQKHNGPSLMGSLLYNKQDVELRTIRSESSMSNSDPSQAIATTNPELKKHLDKITLQFRVVPTTAQSSVEVDAQCSNTVSQNYLLVPLNQTNEQHNNKNYPLPRNMLEGFHYRNSFPQKQDDCDARKYVSDLLEAGRERVNAERENQQTSVPEVTIQNTPGKNINKKPNFNRGEQLKQNVSNQLQSGLLGVEKKSSRPSSAASSRSSRSARSARNRPCWVDNASITTSCVENPEFLSADEVPSSAAAVAANQKVLDGVNNLHLQEMCTDGDIQKCNVNKEILSLQDLRTKKLSLPDLICPSSEEKSREAAVKEWIEKSSFPWALRTVPLL